MKKKPTAYRLYQINQELGGLLRELNDYSVTPSTYECSSHVTRNLEEAFKFADAWFREVAADERLEEMMKELRDEEFSQFKMTQQRMFDNDGTGFHN